MTNSLDHQNKNILHVKYTSTPHKDQISEADLTEIYEFLNKKEYVHSNLTTLPTDTLSNYSNNPELITSMQGRSNYPNLEPAQA